MQGNVLFNHIKVHADQVKYAADCLGRLNFFFASPINIMYVRNIIYVNPPFSNHDQ